MEHYYFFELEWEGQTECFIFKRNIPYTKELEKQIEELEQKESESTTLISLYIPPNKEVSDVISDLEREFEFTNNISSESTRENHNDLQKTNNSAIFL